MNQTKKLTQGAMMLAIVGALILLDRMTAYWFTELIVLMMPVVIIMYATMHTMKDGIMLSVGLLIISFLLGNFQFTYLIYVPVGIVTGLAYAFGIKRGFDKRRLLLVSILTYTLGELVATFIVYPLLGFPVAKMLEEYRIAIESAGTMTGMDYKQVFALAGLDLSKMIGILYVISTVLMGAMEGVLIHLLSVFLLLKFKIYNLGRTNIFDIKPNPVLAYASLIMTSMIYMTRLTDNETVYYIFVIMGIMGSMVLLYYGYIFVVLYGVIVIRRNVGAIFILLCLFIPYLFMVLLILGFLYGSGPLRVYLERKAQELKQ
ncbi:MAG: DUF2232 domain-containing protein [Erysipelotrichaceae bacterium]|nr:DUF2232 domain-containing protein [Erysipelotrichaceae bacterium]